MTCRTYSSLFAFFCPARSEAIDTATLGPRMLYQLGSLPLRSKLLSQRIGTLKLRSLAPWPLQKPKRTQESALLEFDEKVK